MTQPTPIDEQLREFLYEYTDTMDLPDTDPKIIARQYGLHPDDVTTYSELVAQLDDALIQVEPSRQFKSGLQQELLGGSQRTWFGQVRNISPRLQFAAGIALLAAMALLGRRRFFAEASRLYQQFRAGSSTGGDATPQEAKISAG